ncbi:hypothetical protein P3S67_013527 [Capsicum chacoense]
MTQLNISTDQLALLSLKSQIISDPFHYLDESWSPATSVCHWVGVTCGFHHQRVKSLNLSNMNASRLETLELSDNSLQGNIPEGVRSLHNMNSLGIEYNQLVGSIPFTIFNISRIKFIAFTGNSLSGSLPNGLCNGLPALKGLYLSYNKLHGHMPTSLSNCSQLQLLSLSVNEFNGPIHSEIERLSNLQEFYLGNNHFTGTDNSTRNSKSKLGMEDNQITVFVPISIFNISSLQTLTLAPKNLSGFLPREIGNLTKMQPLQISENKLIEISNLVELEELDLAFNSFSGSLDMEIFNISGLRIIDLSFNNLSGSLPPNIDSILPNIEELYLANITCLVGTIPHSISNCSKLKILELSSNKLTGLIPNSLGYVTHLQLLNLEDNNWTSDSSLIFLTSLTNCRNLKILDISLNPLNGMLPASMGNLSMSLTNIIPISCKIQGRIPDEVGNLSSLLDLRLPGNNLAGLIPTTIGNLRNLQRINLRNNKLTGFVGDHICKLQHLGDIYLDQNQLSGSFPTCLGNITSLREIHLGSNKLSSNIPSSLGNLQDLVVLDLSSNNMVEIGGLKNLAHLSLRHKLQGSMPNSMSNMVVYRKGKRAPQQAESLSVITRECVSYYELIQATDLLSESNLIGSGSFGSVYKGVLRSGTAIAVKVFNVQLDAAFKSFDTECDILRSLRHRNLVKVITSCSNRNFKALVLEHMPNGSLEKYLYWHYYFLDIRQRLSIMIDVACALEYLHHGCSLPVIHYDLKPSNVLLDEDMVSHLSDFGISKLLGEDEKYGQDGLVSAKCDVYSYGIMLLETFTRRKQSEFEEDLSLKQWVSYSLPDAVIDVADANLVPPTYNHLLQKYLYCCAEFPSKRTNIKDVVGMLQKIRIQLLAC